MIINFFFKESEDLRDRMMTMEAELRALRDELSTRSNLASNQRENNIKDNNIENNTNIIEENQSNDNKKNISNSTNNTMLEDQNTTTTDHHGSTDNRIAGSDRITGSDLKIKKIASEKIIENNDNIINLNQSNIKDSQDEFKSNT